jgi:hypothetical protein
MAIISNDDFSKLASTLQFRPGEEPFIYIVIPTRGDVDAYTVNSLVHTTIVAERAKLKCAFQVLVAGGGGISLGRELCVAQALQVPFTHLLFIDSDVGWHPITFVRLLMSDFDFCAAIYQMRADGGALCCERLPGAPAHRDGFVEVEHVGFGMVMLKRSVIEAMAKRYSTLAYRWDDGSVHHGLFLEMIEGMRRYGEDYAFCRRWRLMGGKIWIDATAKMVHAGRKEWSACVAHKAQTIWPDAVELQCHLAGQMGGVT